jgi:threonine synthase
MKFFSTNREAPELSFQDAVVMGLAPDNGLYFPKQIPKLGKEVLNQLDHLKPHEIGFYMMRPFVSENLDEEELIEILEETLSFQIPIQQITEQIFTLELFHGPTLAFKDVGARFMSRCMAHFSEDSHNVTVLVATSGDTGSAVANGFLGVDGVDVIVLYPKGKVSKLQEKQFATLGKNITAIAVDGVFDDCQKLVKDAFLDHELRNALHLSSANSINLARWLPQSIYYGLLVPQMRKLVGSEKEIVVSVPSGNFGNLTAGILAQKMGIPIRRFISATNANDVVPEFLSSGVYRPRPSVETIANAMDVGAPSNFSRLLELYDGSIPNVQNHLKGYAFDDQTIKATMAEVYNKSGYLLDPHGATGFKALEIDGLDSNEVGVFIETAHPAKFGKTVEEAASVTVEIPERLKIFANREVVSIEMENDFGTFKSFLKKLYI